MLPDRDSLHKWLNCAKSEWIHPWAAPLQALAGADIGFILLQIKDEATTGTKAMYTLVNVWPLDSWWTATYIEKPGRS